MSALQDLKLLFLDCQTTGATPDHGDILEIAWCLASASDQQVSTIESFLVKPEGFSNVPGRIRQLTGIRTDEVLACGRSLPCVYQMLQDAVTLCGENKIAVAHFARFEQAFLEDLYVRTTEANGLPFKLLCTHDIATRLFPNLPARSLRALAGFFNRPISHLKRANCHVEATFSIWKSLVGELAKRDIVTLEQLQQWLDTFPKPKKEKHEYPIERMMRLNLPHEPGIYKMLSRAGDILYVGKATSLKARVNSYFRGRKGRDARKLEMLTQTWDIQVVQTPTALEAALLESDEIKRLAPPYNVSLQSGNRRLCFFDRSLTEKSYEQNDKFPYGPFTTASAFETMQGLIEGGKLAHIPMRLFWGQFTEGELVEGFEQFCTEYGFIPEALTVRRLAALGWTLIRREQRATSDTVDVIEAAIEDLEVEPKESDTETIEPSQTVQQAIENLCKHLFMSLERAKLLSKLLFAEIKWQEKRKRHTLRFEFGTHVAKRNNKRSRQNPWNGLGILEYDRMAVLAAELKRSGRLEKVFRKI